MIPVSLVVVFVQFVGVDCTGIGSLDTLLPYCWKTDEVFDLPEGQTKMWRKSSLVGDVALSNRGFTACPVNFAADWRLSMHESCTMIFSCDGTPSSPFRAMGGELRDDDLVPNRDDDHRDDWDFDDVPADSHVDVHASLLLTL